LGERDGDVIDVELGTVDWLAREVAGYGADAVVLEPVALRDDVIARLTAQASA
ncbi:MAG: WYL domain-containing protein, partial [Mycobacterium sp.]|nr:WYL domain-containing protein [Mycobacterium sp.]